MDDPKTQHHSQHIFSSSSVENHRKKQYLSPQLPINGHMIASDIEKYKGAFVL
jgi:hypothetical protein